jgi:hypothetical protein
MEALIGPGSLHNEQGFMFKAIHTDMPVIRYCNFPRRSLMPLYVQQS